MASTIDTIVDASYDIPMSIIIVGIGPGPFKNMVQLDADDERMVDAFGKS